VSAKTGWLFPATATIISMSLEKPSEFFFLGSHYVVDAA